MRPRPGGLQQGRSLRASGRPSQGFGRPLKPRRPALAPGSARGSATARAWGSEPARDHPRLVSLRKPSSTVCLSGGMEGRRTFDG